MGVGEDGKVGVHRDVTADSRGSGMQDGRWKFSWDDCWVSDEEDAEVGEVMSLVGLADGIWSELVLSGKEKSWRKGCDAVNACNFGGAVGESSQRFRYFGLKCVAMADSDWDEDDSRSAWTKNRFDLGKNNGGGDLINYDCDKYDDDNCDNCGDNTPCNVSMISFKDFMFPFQIR